MNDLELAQRYLPHFYVDEKEPFPIERIGYRVFRAPGKSQSFPRDILLREGAALAIEYAVYFDFDIQHLYELEHAWIYVDADGKVVDGEASSHGRVLNCMRLSAGLEEETHLPLYMQPGKHAMLPRGDLFPLFPDYLRACGKNAGNMGLLNPALFKDQFPRPQGCHERVERYLKQFAFEPSFCYHPAAVPQDALTPVEELLAWIPGRIARVLETIMAEPC